MKVVILAGGLGTRLSEETTIKPKPMVEVSGKLRQRNGGQEFAARLFVELDEGSGES